MNIYSQKITITEEIERRFKPTRLAVKELNDIRYLCKSTKNNFYKYNGSGVRWLKHLRKHGKNNVKTLWISDWFYCPHHLQDFALMYSEYNQIVESDDWANLVPENGLTGCHGSTKEIQNRPEVREKKKKSMLGKNIGKRGPYRPRGGGCYGPRNNFAIYTWENVGTKEVEVMSAYDLCKKYNISPGHLAGVITGIKKTAKGWKISDSVLGPRSGTSQDNMIYEWINIYNDERCYSTRSSMIEKYDLNHGNVSKMIAGKKGYKSVKGWKVVSSSPNTQDDYSTV